MRQTLVLKSLAALFPVPSDRITIFFPAMALASMPHAAMLPPACCGDKRHARRAPAAPRPARRWQRLLNPLRPQFRPGTCQNGLQGLGFHAQLRGALAAVRALSESR